MDLAIASGVCMWLPGSQASAEQCLLSLRAGCSPSLCRLPLSEVGGGFGRCRFPPWVLSSLLEVVMASFSPQSGLWDSSLCLHSIKWPLWITGDEGFLFPLHPSLSHSEDCPSLLETPMHLFLPAVSDFVASQTSPKCGARQ